MSDTITGPGAPLIAQLLASHEHFPRYHEIALDLAGRAATDASAAARLDRLVGQYVHHLHIHHTAEELELFPAIRRAAPDLDESVDTLLEHHRQLAIHLDDVTARLGDLASTPRDTPDYGNALDSLVETLNALHRHVEFHLEFEESTTIPVISTWTEWPFAA